MVNSNRPNPKYRTRRRSRVHLRKYKPRQLTPKQKLKRLASIAAERKMDKLFNAMCDSISNYILAKKVNTRTKTYYGMDNF